MCLAKFCSYTTVDDNRHIFNKVLLYDLLVVGAEFCSTILMLRDSKSLVKRHQVSKTTQLSHQCLMYVAHFIISSR